MDAQQTQTPPAAAKDGPSEMMILGRKATARIVTAALEATAESADMERAALAHKYPAQPMPLGLHLEPEDLRAFTRSESYAALVDRYVRGETVGLLIVHVVRLLKKDLPALFA